MPNLLKLTKEQRKSLYKWWWKNYTYIDPRMSTVPNPNVRNLMIITERFLSRTLTIEHEDEAKEVIQRYRPKFVLWAQKRVKKNGGWPKHQNRTEVIKEFIKRGFIHQADAVHIPGKYVVIALIGELQWPVSFEFHQEALEVSKRFGIPGYTSCPIPGK